MKDKILKLLRGLGRSQKSIKNNLLKKNCHGKRLSSTCCPVANLLKRNFKTRVRVTPGYIYVRNHYIEVSKHLSRFIYSFDMGKHKDLVK